MRRSICSLCVVAALGMAPLTATANNDWQDTAKDAWIDGKAETTLLLNGNLNSFDINTDVNDGIVTLTGKVESDVDRSLAEELVAGLDGVESVNNKLTVQINRDDAEGDIDMRRSLTDTKVETVVKTRLLMESEVSGTDIEVEVDDGVVTLKGEVESDAAKDLAIAIAENTSDVEDVIDELKIQSSENS